MGLVCTVRPQWKIRLNVDMVGFLFLTITFFVFKTCKAFFPSGNLADILYCKYGNKLKSLSCSDALCDIKHLRVEAKFYVSKETLKPYSRRYTIYNISTKSAYNLWIEEMKQSVFEYFKEHYCITLQYPELPCVKVLTSLNNFIIYKGFCELRNVYAHGVAIRPSLSKSNCEKRGYSE